MANKISAIFIGVICFFGTINAQSINFFKTYGGNGYDYGQGIVQLPDSGYAVTGASSSFDNAPSQAFILRLDSMGNYKWSLNYGGGQSDWGRRIFYSPTQGYWVAGYSNSFGAGDFDFYLLKTDVTGTKQWEKTYGTTDLERLWDAVLLPDSGLVMVGQTSGALSLDEDIYIVRTDFNGDTVWTKRIQSAGVDIAYTCLLINDTTVIIGGKSSNTSNNMTAYLASIDVDGTVNWEKFNGTQGAGEIYDMDTLSGSLFSAGGITLIDSADLDHWQMHTDLSGNFIQEYIVSRPKEDYISHIASRNNKLYVTAWTVTTDFVLYPGGADLFLVNYDQGYNWGGFSKSYSGLDPDECHQIIRTSDGGLALVGWASDFHFSSGGSDISLIKIGANDESPAGVNGKLTLVSIQEETLDKDFVIYPNPVSDVLHISMDKTTTMQYALTDVYGKILISGELQETMDMNQYPEGIYFLQISSSTSSKVVRIVKH